MPKRKDVEDFRLLAVEEMNLAGRAAESAEYYAKQRDRWKQIANLLEAIAQDIPDKED